MLPDLRKHDQSICDCPAECSVLFLPTIRGKQIIFQLFFCLFKTLIEDKDVRELRGNRQRRNPDKNGYFYRIENVKIEVVKDLEFLVLDFGKIRDARISGVTDLLRQVLGKSIK